MCSVLLLAEQAYLMKGSFVDVILRERILTLALFIADVTMVIHPPVTCNLHVFSMCSKKPNVSASVVIGRNQGADLTEQSRELRKDS